MKRKAAQLLDGILRTAAVAALAAAVSSCTTATVPDLNTITPSFAPNGTVSLASVEASDAGDGGVATESADAVTAGGAFPATIAYLPTPNPRNASAIPTQVAAAPASPGAVAGQVSANPATTPAPETEIRLAAMESAPRSVAREATVTDVPPPRPEAVLSADHSKEPVFENAAPAAPAKKPKGGLFAAFFGAPKQPAAPAAKAARALPADEATPVVLASAGPNAGVSLREALTGTELPGVRKSALFEISRKSGLDDDSDVDLTEDNAAPVRLASAAGLARLAPNGLLVQHEGVETACLKPELVKRLRLIERHYGKRVVVTSGYRSPQHNKRVRGARKSLHMACAAADIQVPGVGKWELARYVRTMPGRGGVGTYCHTESVHVDIGQERDWNWRCRRSKKK